MVGRARAASPATDASLRSISSSSWTTARTGRWATIGRPAMPHRSSGSRWPCGGAASASSPTRRRATQQRSPGPMQANGIMEPVVTKAAEEARPRPARYPPHQFARRQGALRRAARRTGSAATSPSAFVKEALDRGAERFKWDERKARSGQRQGSKVRGIGVAVGPHGAGSIGFDGLMIIQPDGKLLRAVRRRESRHALAASTSRASPPKRWRCRGTRLSSTGATRRRTCRGRRCRSAARRRMR